MHFQLWHFSKKNSLILTQLYQAASRFEYFAVHLTKQVVAVGENSERTRCVSYECAPACHATVRQLSRLCAVYLYTNRVLCTLTILVVVSSLLFHNYSSSTLGILISCVLLNYWYYINSLPALSRNVLSLHSSSFIPFPSPVCEGHGEMVLKTMYGEENCLMQVRLEGGH